MRPPGLKKCAGPSTSMATAPSRSSALTKSPSSPSRVCEAFRRQQSLRQQADPRLVCTTQSCTHNDGTKAGAYLVRSQKEQIQGIARLLINTLSDYGLIVLLHHALECRLRTVVCMPSGDGKSTSGEQGNRRAWRTPGRAEQRRNSLQWSCGGAKAWRDSLNAPRTLHGPSVAVCPKLP